MKVLGISPLDKDATASIVEDGRIVFAAGEERFSRVKQHAGFPRRAVEAALEATGTDPQEIEQVVYAFLPWETEARLIDEAMAAERTFASGARRPNSTKSLAAARGRIPPRSTPIHGLHHPNETMRKGWAKETFYRLAGVSGAAALFARRASRRWAGEASLVHKRYHEELEVELGRLGLLAKLKRYEHHLSHAANAYLMSGFPRALVVTIDGYGTGLAGSISLGEHGQLKRLHNLRFPHSLGSFYEMVTSSLGFHPDRHAGKVVGLAAYGDPRVLGEALLERFVETPGDFRILDNLNVYFSRHLASHFPKVDVAAAYQHVLEQVACRLVQHWADQTGCRDVVLSGGVTANVKMNQRIHEITGVERIFVYPNMGDGGCGSGLALLRTWPTGHDPVAIHDVYLGPAFGEAEIRAELEASHLRYERPPNLAAEVARRIHGGEVIGRFDGRMEYGPRALGNRSILYHAREPEVNAWLNKRLGRTEFMPFAPVTLWEERERCYRHLQGGEHCAEFMTITFDCTDWMRQSCPAAVHVDGTARPQLVKRDKNPGYHAVLSEYFQLSGIPCLINTSFNMHEEPIVCSPKDAVRAFLLGHLDGLAIGPYFVENPRGKESQPAGAKRG